MHHPQTRWIPDLPLVAVFLLFDGVSCVYALYGLNITPWNPDPAHGPLVQSAESGRKVAA